MIYGGEGRDTAIFGGSFGNYRFINLANGDLAVIGAEGETTLNAVDVLQFADMSVERANLAAADTLAPVAPVMAVTKNGNHFATTGNVLALNGTAEANAAVKVFIGNELIATATAGSNGLWSAVSLALKDGLNYQAYATATDAAGNVSAASGPVVFHIDSVAPSVPTLNVALATGGNQPVFTGTGEAGTAIELYRLGDFTKIGSADVGADGKWVLNSQPLPNGNYNVRVVSVDKAGNARSGADENVASITISHNGYQAGTANRDIITMNLGNNAVDGGAGLDTVVFSGTRASYTIRSEDWGFSATAANGEVDGLFNVERIKFDDMMMALDINGSAGEIYRLYQAAFDRVPDGGGLAHWINRTDQGDSMMQIAQYFAQNKEYIDLYANTSNEQFVTKLYEHVLDRAPEGGGYDFWVGNLNRGSTNRDEVLTLFSESPENQAQVIGSIVNGIEYPFPIA